MKPRRGGLKPVGSLVGRVLASGALGEALRHARLAAAWRQTVGEKAAGDTLPLSLKRGVLTVGVTTSARMHLLMLEKQAILDVMRAKVDFDAIRDIRFKATGAKPVFQSPDKTREWNAKG